MKNKIFELYKPRSLEEFLEFYKNNPKERFVYVVQQPAPNINILSASDFGYLVICLPNREQAIYSTAPYTQKMQKKFTRLSQRRLFTCSRRSCNNRYINCNCS